MAENRRKQRKGSFACVVEKEHIIGITKHESGGHRRGRRPVASKHQITEHLFHENDFIRIGIACSRFFCGPRCLAAVLTIPRP